MHQTNEPPHGRYGETVKPASQTKSALSRCALFRNLPPAALAAVAERVTTKNATRGERLFAAGERCSAVYIVLSGRIMLSVGSTDTASKVIDLIGNGGHFGLAAAILDSTHNVSADALTDSVLAIVPRAALLEAAAGRAELALQIATALSRGIASLTRDIEAYSLHSGRQRVADYLLETAAANAGRSRPFPLPAKKSVIASRLGLTPEYFSRMLHELIVARAIVVEGRQITVLDPDALRGGSAGAAA